jgi:hypothetical protein
MSENIRKLLCEQHTQESVADKGYRIARPYAPRGKWSLVYSMQACAGARCVAEGFNPVAPRQLKAHSAISAKASSLSFWPY